MDLELRSAYWDDPRARGAFEEFILEIFGLDFTEWEEAGYWDDAYTPFSLFDGDTVVASACFYLLDAVIDRRSTRVAQVSGVGTLPEWRRKGLGRRLLEVGLEWARDRQEGVFLFADAGATPLYEKCGFEPRIEYLELTDPLPVQRRAGLVKLDCGRRSDLDRIHQRAKRREPISEKFSVLNEKLLMFHALHDLRQCAYEVPELDCIVFFERGGGLLQVYDIVGERVPHLSELYPYLADEADRLVEFHFHTDKLGLEETRTRPLPEQECYVKIPFPVEKPVFPFTSKA